MSPIKISRMEALELSREFINALDVIEKQGKHVFITGKAGTGKSTLLQLFRNTTRKNTVVLAPTGIAALNVKGQTIHSFFKFPAKPLAREDIKKRRNRKVYKKLEVLVIDEISMVRADLLDNIDYFLRINRENHLPFGGVQVVFFGDLFQLPPVVSSDVEKQLFQSFYESPYFFSAKVFEDGFLTENIELQKVYRQKNRHFLRLLETIRLNRADYDDLEDFNERYLPEFESEEFYITLAARNARADAINQKALAAIPLPETASIADIKGSFSPKLYPTEAILKLKLSAQVMMIKNDPERRFVNGTIGQIVKLENNKVTVMTEKENGQKNYVTVEKMEWEVLKYKMGEKDPSKIETEVVGTFRQFPLKLAWGITIHKSQGKTFDKVIIDMGNKGAFEFGQTYVALSRCRTMQGLVLKQPLRPRDIMTDDRIVSYYEQNFY